MYIHVRVQAGATKERVEASGENRWQVAVKEPAERNLANGRILDIMAARYKVPRGQVRIVSGHRSPSKIISIPD